MAKKNSLKRYRLADIYNCYSSCHTLNSSSIHGHLYYEMEIALSGKGTHTVNSVTYEWKRGAICFLRLTDFHEINLSERAEVITLQLAPSYLSEDILNIINTFSGVPVAYLSEEETQFFEALHKRIYAEIVLKCEKNGELIRRLFETAIYIFLSGFKDIQHTKPQKIYDEKISKIVSYIHTHFKEDLTLDLIAKEFFINKNYLCAYFKKHMYVTILSYIKSTRLNYAAKLAVNGNLKNVELCSMCGYGSVSNFLRDFKKKFGCSPLQMRKSKKI